MSDIYVDRADLADVRQWLRVVEPGGELTTIKIMHQGTRDPVREYTRAKGEFPNVEEIDTQKCDDFIEAIAKKIEGDAAGWDGSPETYFVEAYFGGAHRHSDRIPFKVQIEKGSKENRRGRTFPTTIEGVQALLMQLANDGNTRSLQAYEKIIGHVLRLNAEGHGREVAMRKEIDDMRTALVTLTSLEKDAERKDRQLADEQKMKAELLADAKVLLKIIANKAYGGTLLPEGELSPEQRLIRQAVKELESGQIEMLMELFQEKHPRIAQMIGELVSTVQDEDARRAGIAKMLEERKAKELEAAPKSTALVPTNGASKINGNAPTIGPLRGEPLQR